MRFLVTSTGNGVLQLFQKSASQAEFQKCTVHGRLRNKSLDLSLSFNTFVESSFLKNTESHLAVEWLEVGNGRTGFPNQLKQAQELRF